MKGLAFLIAETASGAPSGLCGVDEWFPDDSVQIGSFLAMAGRGKGYATRAVDLLTNWLFALGAVKIFATVDTLNVASSAVLRRATCPKLDVENSERSRCATPAPCVLARRRARAARARCRAKRR
jgi:GNAT acetyltransferase-like protein